MKTVRMTRIPRLIHLKESGVVLKLISAWYDDEDWVLRYLSILQNSDERMIPTPLVVFNGHAGLYLVSSLPPDDHASAERYITTGMTLGITRASERELLLAYGFKECYWSGRDIWGDGPRPTHGGYYREGGNGRHGGEETVSMSPDDEARETHVFCTFDLLGSNVLCSDGALGTVSDLLLDTHTWRIKYLFVYNRGREEEALLSPFWLSRPDKTDFCAPFTVGTVLNSPAYIPETVSPKDEKILAKYYGFLPNE